MDQVPYPPSRYAIAFTAAVEKRKLEPMIISQIFTVCSNLLGLFKVKPVIDVTSCEMNHAAACTNVQEAIKKMKKWVDECDVK
jgi:hypothetical protein